MFGNYMTDTIHNSIVIQILNILEIYMKFVKPLETAAPATNLIYTGNIVWIITLTLIK